jgi:iron complex transport system substrate-binding protein
VVFAAALLLAGRTAPAQETTRIVSLVPNMTEILFAIGAEGQVVGTTDFCNYPEEAKRRTRVGGLLNPNIERIVSLRPTAVVHLNSQGDVAAKLASLGVRNVPVRSDSLTEVLDSIATAGELTGRTADSDALTSAIRSRLEQLRARYRDSARVRTLIVVGRQPASLQNIYAAGPDTYLGALLEAAGGENLAPRGANPYPPVTKERILELNPDVIIDTSLGEAGSKPGVIEQHKRAWSELTAVSAVRKNRVHYLSDPRLTIPGPDLPKTADEIASLLHPQ